MDITNNVNIAYFINHPGEFKRVSRTYDCEVPKGDCFRVVVRHIGTGEHYEYFEETQYSSLADQVNDTMGEFEFTLIDDGT